MSETQLVCKISSLTKTTFCIIDPNLSDGSKNYSRGVMKMYPILLRLIQYDNE